MTIPIKSGYGDAFDAMMEQRELLFSGIAVDPLNAQYRENIAHVSDKVVAISASDISVLDVPTDALADDFVFGRSISEGTLAAEGRRRITLSKGSIAQIPVQAVVCTFFVDAEGPGFHAKVGAYKTGAVTLNNGEAATARIRNERAQRYRSAEQQLSESDDVELFEEITRSVQFIEVAKAALFYAEIKKHYNREPIDIGATQDYIASGRLRDFIQAKRREQDVDDYEKYAPYVNAVYMTLGNSLHAQIMQSRGIPGISLAVDASGAEKKLVRIGEPLSEELHLVGGFTAPTRNPLHAINVLNVAAHLQRPKSPDYPYDEERIDKLVATREKIRAHMMQG
jgi:hypothetical protein